MYYLVLFIKREKQIIIVDGKPVHSIFREIERIPFSDEKELIKLIKEYYTYPYEIGDYSEIFDTKKNMYLRYFEKIDLFPNVYD